MKKKKAKTLKNVHATDATSYNIPLIADSDESSTADEPVDDMDILDEADDRNPN